jgi:hypothetical protein
MRWTNSQPAATLVSPLEEERQEVLGAGFVAGGRDVDVVGEPVHVLAALRARSREHQAAHEPRPDERELLRDEPAEREAEQVDLAQLQRLEEAQRVVRHRGHRARRAAGRPADAGVVEQDHLAHRGQRVDERGVPVVEVAAEMLQQDQRRSADRVVAEAAVRIRDAVGRLDGEVRGGGQGIGREHRGLRGKRSVQDAKWRLARLCRAPETPRTSPRSCFHPGRWTT